MALFAGLSICLSYVFLYSFVGGEFVELCLLTSCLPRIPAVVPFVWDVLAQHQQKSFAVLKKIPAIESYFFRTDDKSKIYRGFPYLNNLMSGIISRENLF
jgi:hypothetical protein